MGWDGYMAQCFLSGVWSEAVQATPTASHYAVAKLAENNRLLRYKYIQRGPCCPPIASHARRRSLIRERRGVSHSVCLSSPH